MPSIIHEIEIERSAEDIWDAVRDVGALHTRLVPGFVTATEMVEGVAVSTRRVTFANGVVADEVIVTIDDERRRLVWSVKDFQHHNGALQISPARVGARVTWTADVLPAEVAERIAPMMWVGLQKMKEHLEANGIT